MSDRFKPAAFLNSDSGKWSLMIFATALVVRVANLIFLSQNDPAFYFPQVDSLWHHLWALDIVDRSFWGDDVYFRGPLYPYFLALIYAVFGAKIFIAKTIQAIGGAVICVLIYQLGKPAFNERTARIASLVAVFYGPMIFYESELLIEWLAILPALAMLLVLMRSKELTPRSLLLAGIFGGLSAIARPNILVVFPLIAFWILLRDSRAMILKRRLISALVFSLGVILCILPVTIRNYVVADDFVLISSQGGVNLHVANNLEADGLTMIMPEIALNLSVPWSEFVDTTTAYAESAVGRKLKPSEVSSFWSDRAWSYILDHPLSFATLTGKRFVYLFSGFENSDQADIYRFGENSPILTALTFDFGIKFPFGIVGPLSMVGLVTAWQQRKRIALLYLFLLGYVPTVILFLVTARHRLAIVVILIIFAAFSVERIWSWIRERKNTAVIGALLSFVLLAALLNHNWFDLGYDNPAQFHYQRGLVLEKQGDTDAAIAEYREAIKFQQLPEALNNLGFALARKGDAQGAYNAYHGALRSRPNYADADINLGLLFMKNNALDSAELYFRATEKIAPNLPQVYLNLGDLSSQRGDLAGAEALYQEGIRRQPQFAPLYNALANLYLRQSRDSEATPLLETAVSIDPKYATAHVNLGSIALNHGDLPSAKKHYQRAIEIRPDFKAAHVNLALLYIREGLPDSARTHLNAAIQLDPNDSQVRQMLERLH